MATGVLVGLGGMLLFRGFTGKSNLSYVGGAFFLCAGIGLFVLKAHHQAVMTGAV